MLSFRGSLYIVDINQLSNILFANIFFNKFAFHCIDCVLWGTEIFHFDEIWLIFSFVASAVDVISKKSLPNPMSWKISYVFF